jgi:hypothetical protein
MIRMLIVGYGFGIRSERRLCEEVHLNLAYRCCQLRCFRLARWEALGRVQASCVLNARRRRRTGWVEKDRTA